MAKAAKPRGTAGAVVLLTFVAGLATAAAGAAALLLLREAPPAGSQGDALSRAASAHNAVQRERLERLRQTARLLAADPLLAAALGGEPEAPDPIASGKRLYDLRGSHGYDAAWLVGGDRKVLARSDRAPAPGESLIGDPLIGERLAVVAGARADGDGLVYAAAAPVLRDFQPLGWVVATLAVDSTLAVEVARVSGADVAYAAVTPTGGRVVGASRDLGAAQAILGSVGLTSLTRQGESISRQQPSAAGRRWDVLAMPLAAAGEGSAGAILAFQPLVRRGLPPSLPVIAGAGLAVPLLLLPLAIAAGRRGAGPAGRLEAAVRAARAGDWDQRLDPRHAGPLAGLADALGGLFSDLGEREALAQVAVAAAERESASSTAASGEATEGPATLLALDLRRFASGRVGFDARETGERLERDLSRAEAAIAGRGGRVEALLGHRLLAAFEGEGATAQALAAAAELLVVLGMRESAFDESEPPTAAIAAGKVIRGTSAVGGRPVATLVGPPVQLLDSLLREGEPGEVLLGPGPARELVAAGVEVGSRRGHLTPRPLQVLSTAAAARAAGIHTEGLGGASPPAGGSGLSGEETAVVHVADLAVGSRLDDRFEILAPLGRGAGGALFRARDRGLGEIVALRVFAPEAEADPGLFERLDGPLQRLRKLIHPHVARVWDAGRAQGLAYLSRELAPGASLEEILARTGNLPAPAALRLLRQIAGALAAAHGDGFVHGRLSPRNVIVAPDGRARITDFGVSLVVRPEPGGPAVDRAGDVWAAGAVVHRALTGNWPEPGGFTGPEPLAGVLARCLAADPGARFADGAALVAALDGIRR